MQNRGILGAGVNPFSNLFLGAGSPQAHVPLNMLMLYTCCAYGGETWVFGTFDTLLKVCNLFLLCLCFCFPCKDLCFILFFGLFFTNSFLYFKPRNIFSKHCVFPPDHFPLFCTTNTVCGRINQMFILSRVSGVILLIFSLILQSSDLLQLL